MTRTRLVPALIIGTVAAALLAGCTTPTTAPTTAAPTTSAPGTTTTAPPASNTTITFMVFETPALTASFWDASITNATAKVPGLKANKIVSPDADRNAYAKQLQASGQFPDVLSSINPKDFLEAGLLAPFDQAWLDANFLQPQGNAIQGKSYIPPTNSQIIPLVYYNKKIFADNNLTPPKTWAEFMNAVTTLRAAGVTPIELAGADPWAASMPLVGLASADVLGKDPQWIQKRFAGTVKFTDPLFKTAMQKAVDLVKAKAYDPAALSVDFATANKNFLDGKSAMYPEGSWFTGASYITPEQAANIGAFPWPTNDGTIVIPFNMGGTTSVSAKSAATADAMAFAQAWSLAPENLKVLIETDGAYPMLKNQTLESFGATVNELFTATYALVTSDNTKVSAFGWVNNDDALAPGLNDSFYALAQSFFSNDDVAAQLAQLDSDWDQATK